MRCACERWSDSFETRCALQVDSFSARIKPEAKDVAEEEEEEGIGDVDLFTLTEGGTALTVNAKWLQHLQARA